MANDDSRTIGEEVNSSDPDGFEALIAQGSAAMQADDDAAAAVCFASAMALRPQAGLPHFLVGSLRAAAGDMEQAEAAFASAILLAPDLWLARYQLGLLQFSSGRAAVAMLTWQPLLAMPASEPVHHFVQGFAALAQDRFDEALQHYHEGLRLNPGNEAMGNDIRKVIAGIEALWAPAADLADAEPDSGGHVLLAAYETQGRPH